VLKSRAHGSTEKLSFLPGPAALVQKVLLDANCSRHFKLAPTFL
jgi:hypothetical protein